MANYKVGDRVFIPQFDELPADYGTIVELDVDGPHVHSVLIDGDLEPVDVEEENMVPRPAVG